MMALSRHEHIHDASCDLTVPRFLCILMSIHASLDLPFKLPMTFSTDRQSRCWFANIGDTDRNKGNVC